MSCESLEADGTVEANYKKDIIACVEKRGRVYCRHAECGNAAFRRVQPESTGPQSDS